MFLALYIARSQATLAKYIKGTVNLPKKAQEKRIDLNNFSSMLMDLFVPFLVRRITLILPIRVLC